MPPPIRAPRLPPKPLSSAQPQPIGSLAAQTPAPSPRRLNADIPPRLEQIILKLLAKEPSARYRTADQLGRILETLIAMPAGGANQGTAPSINAIDVAHSSETMAMDLPAGAGVDWVAIGLGLAAFLALGGLVPLWLWVCLLYPSCPINAG